MIHQKTWSFGMRLVKTGSSRTLVRQEECLWREWEEKREKRSEEGKKGKADWVGMWEKKRWEKCYTSNLSWNLVWVLQWEKKRKEKKGEKRKKEREKKKRRGKKKEKSEKRKRKKRVKVNRQRVVSAVGGQQWEQGKNLVRGKVRHKG